MGLGGGESYVPMGLAFVAFGDPMLAHGALFLRRSAANGNPPPQEAAWGRIVCARRWVIRCERREPTTSGGLCGGVVVARGGVRNRGGLRKSKSSRDGRTT